MAGSIAFCNGHAARALVDGRAPASTTRPPRAASTVSAMARAIRAQLDRQTFSEPIDRRREDSPAQDVSNKADFVGLSPRLLSIGLSP